MKKCKPRKFEEPEEPYLIRLETFAKCWNCIFINRQNMVCQHNLPYSWSRNRSRNFCCMAFQARMIGEPLTEAVDPRILPAHETDGGRE
ncbi:hypothetical protein SDC9_155776 [bioreactor metagenome]|uniref:Uncharacterized protein n=1 Tax=bioreactor metagenome TaxID=1076179 RepID=A0A645F7A1_9ZZZZ